MNGTKPRKGDFQVNPRPSFQPQELRIKMDSLKKRKCREKHFFVSSKSLMVVKIASKIFLSPPWQNGIHLKVCKMVLDGFKKALNNLSGSLIENGDLPKTAGQLQDINCITQLS